MKSTKHIKKKYESPKLFKVTLNHDQAILSGCSTSSVRSNSGSVGCRRGCRTGNSKNNDSGPSS